MKLAQAIPSPIFCRLGPIEAKPNAFVGFRASTQPTNQGIFRFGEGIAQEKRISAIAQASRVTYL